MEKVITMNTVVEYAGEERSILSYDNEFGNVTFEGAVYVLLEQAYLEYASGRRPEEYYSADAVKIGGGAEERYEVQWDMSDEWNSREIEERCDESDACDWKTPTTVRKY